MKINAFWMIFFFVAGYMFRYLTTDETAKVGTKETDDSNDTVLDESDKLEKVNTNKYVKCYIGERYTEIPVEDYLEIEAGRYGYSSYEELRKAGLVIELSDNDIIEK